MTAAHRGDSRQRRETAGRQLVPLRSVVCSLLSHGQLHLLSDAARGRPGTR
ncbi:hypothetical protein PH213_35645 [Streptomyces sp. SRF1]|uniref:hypothetical protein n=1 Tax=Streptomyces sp. SRF1 TaxID=1549642 RepID=UPI0025B0D8DA|nr:hypothetical protein [Streptomyces sp. SRF1]MDN3059769.1 hypothetical protein [Streptomyces sp. SRF1]